MSKEKNVKQLAIFCMQISKVQFVDFRGGDQCPAGGGDAGGAGLVPGPGDTRL